MCKHMPVDNFEQLGETLAEYRGILPRFSQILQLENMSGWPEILYDFLMKISGRPYVQKFSLPHAEHVYRYDAFSGKHMKSVQILPVENFLIIEP